MEFTVRRSKWLRGGVNGDLEMADPCLLDGNGHRCCLGFLGAACTVRSESPYKLDNILRTSVDPEDCDAKLIEWPETILTYGEREIYDEDGPHHTVPAGKNTELTCRIVWVNDDGALSEETRESTLTELFKEGGLLVTFED